MPALPPAPPRLALWLLRRFAVPARCAEFEDDLAELFAERVDAHGLGHARLRYWIDVLSICRRRSLRTPRPSSHPPARGPIMWKNYLTTTLRHLRRHAGYALLNVFGLSIGVAACLLIGLFVVDEWSYDRFHERSGDLYRAWVHERYSDDEEFVNTVTPFVLADALRTTFPDVEAAVRVAPLSARVQRGDGSLPERITWADASFFETFSFPLVQGLSAEALSTPRSIVLTETMARKYFGGRPALGKTLSVQLGDAFQDFTVTGVAADPPTASSIKFDFVVPYAAAEDLYSERARQSWFMVLAETYVLLTPDADLDALTAKLDAIGRLALGDRYAPGVYTVGLQPMPEIHLDTSFPAGLAPISDPLYAYILAGIALLILVVACINFMTLATGRSASRSREVGVRKAVGAHRSQLMAQFWGEAVLLSTVSLLVGLILALLFLPYFNDLAGRELAFRASTPGVLLLIALALGVGLVAGSYPAVVLSRFRPTEVLKGTPRLRSRSVIQRGLTVLQFALSTGLIIVTLGMSQQLDFLRSTPLGFDKEHIVILPSTLAIEPGLDVGDRMRQALASEPQVVDVAAASFPMGTGWSRAGFDDDAGRYREFIFNVVSPEYLDVHRIPVVAGRGFDREQPSDARRALVVNEALVRAYGWDNPIGQRLPGPAFPDHEIIGVVADFTHQSLRTEVEPLVLALTPDLVLPGVSNMDSGSSPSPELMIRVRGSDLPATMARLEAAWAALMPDTPFAYQFLDEAVDSQYRQEERLGRITRVGAALSIVIACLGLLGLATLTVVRRTKEIGIRKALGASTPSIAWLLTKEFALLVAVAFALAVPLAFASLQRWLTDFAYHAELGPGLVVLAAALTLGMALLPIGYQAIKASMTNPVHALRYE